MASDFDLEFEKMRDDELFDRIENSAEIRELENSKGWSLLMQACKRTSAQAREALVDIDPNEKVLIVKYQQVAKLYGNVLQSLVSSYKQEGEMAFEEAKNRNILDRFRAAVEAFTE